MKFGIILVFNNTTPFLVKDYIESLNSFSDVTFCLVNNKLNDTALESLTEILDKTNNTKVVNLNKKCSLKAATKYGTRYLNSYYDLKYIGYIDVVNQQDDLEVLSSFNHFKEDVEKLLEESKNSSPIRRFSSNSVFSVVSYLSELHSKNIFANSY